MKRITPGRSATHPHSEGVGRNLLERCPNDRLMMYRVVKRNLIFNGLTKNGCGEEKQEKEDSHGSIFLCL